MDRRADIIREEFGEESCTEHISPHSPTEVKKKQMSTLDYCGLSQTFMSMSVLIIV